MSNRDNGKGRRAYKDESGRRPADRRGGRAKGGVKKGKRVRIILLTVVLVILLVSIAAVMAYKAIVRPPDIPDDSVVTPPTVGLDSSDSPLTGPKGDRKSGHFYTFLLCGTDIAADNTDTIMVISYDVDNQVANIMSIPRDTLINVDWNIKKINGAYPVGGIDRLKEEVRKLIGLQIDYYIIVEKKAVVELVNTIGGVDFDVPVNMYYDDYVGYSVAISKGVHHLNGEDAYKVLRYRLGNNGGGYVDGDIGRINTQQALLTEIAKQTLQVSNLTKVTSFANIFFENVKTDLTLGNLIWFGRQAMSLDTEENLSFMTIPGNYNDSVKGLSYVTVNIDEMLETVNSKINPFLEDVTEQSIDAIARNSSGELYATTGTIRGGYESFWSASGGSGSSGAVSTPPPGSTETYDPDPDDPGTSDPVAVDPGTSDPGTSDPGTSDPGTSDPGTSDPGTSDPGTSDPGTSDPGTSDPGTSDPIVSTAEPANTQTGTEGETV